MHCSGFCWISPVLRWVWKASGGPKQTKWMKTNWRRWNFAQAYKASLGGPDKYESMRIVIPNFCLVLSVEMCNHKIMNKKMYG